MIEKIRGGISWESFRNHIWEGSLVVLLLFILSAKWSVDIVPAGLVGLSICLFLLEGYYGILFQAVRMCNLPVRNAFLAEWRGILTVAAISLFFIFLEINSYHTLYYWDSLETWQPAVHCSHTVFSDPFSALRALKHSINHSDYNDVLPMLLALPLHLMGDAFLSYVLCIWVMFVLPTVFLASVGIQRWMKQYTDTSSGVSTSMAMFLLVPIYELPALWGYANAAYLLPGVLILLLFLELGTEKTEIRKLSMIGGLSVIAVLQSRTAAYMVVGCYFGYAVYVFCLGCLSGDAGKRIRLLVKRYLYLAGFCLGVLFVFFHGFFIHAVSYDFATAYSAYGLGIPLVYRLGVPFVYLGVVLDLLLLFASAAGLCHKRHRPQTLFLLCWLISSTVLVSRVQVMSVQHTYTMLLPAMVLPVACIAIFLDRCRRAGTVMVMLAAVNFVQMFSGHGLLEDGFQIKGMYLPQVRYDINEIRRMVADINFMEGETGKVYILASSKAYNESVFQKIDFPEKENSLPNALPVSAVDLRDGFPLGFFEADIVVVADPIQTHLRPQDQSVVSVLADMMLRDTPVSRHFRLVKEYEMCPDKIPISDPEWESRCVKMKVYRKIMPLEKADINYVADAFEKLYPSHPQLFHDRFVSYEERFQ